MTSFSPGLKTKVVRLETAVSPLWVAPLYLGISLLLAWTGFRLSANFGLIAWFLSGGMHLALIWIFGFMYVPLVLVSAGVGWWLFYPEPLTWTTLVGLGSTSALAYGVAGLLLRERLLVSWALDSLRDVMRFIMVALLTAVFLGPVSAFHLLVSGLAQETFTAVAFTISLGHLVGTLMVTPFFMVNVAAHLPDWLSQKDAWKKALRKPDWQKWLRMTNQVLFLLGSIFLSLWLVVIGYVSGRYLLLYLNFLPLIWIAMRYGVRGTTFGILIINLSLVSTISSLSLTMNVTELRLFLLTLTVSGLVMGAAVTERSQTMKQTAFQALLLNSLRESVIVFDTSGVIMYWGRGAERLYGFSREEAEGQQIDILLPEQDKNLHQHITEVKRLGMWTGQYQRQAKSGVIFPVDTVLSLVSNRDGQPRGIIAIDRDLVQRLEVQRALERSNEQLEALRQISLALTAELELDDLLLAVVQSAINLLNATSGGIYIYRADVDALEWQVAIGENLVPLGYILQRGEGLSGRVLEQKRPIIINDYRNWSGKKTDTDTLYPWKSVIGVPLQWRGEFLGVLDVLHSNDNTFTQQDADMLSALANQAAVAIQNARLYDALRRHAEELEDRVLERTRALAAANDQLKELDRLKSKFVSDVSHELRTPVTNLLLYLDLIHRTTDPERQQHHLGVLRKETQRLRHLVENVLALSRLDFKYKPVEFVPVDLNVLIRRVVADQSAGATAVNLKLIVNLADDLPLVNGVKEQLEQVITNLVSNAIKYTPQGSIEVKSGRQVELDEVWFSVSDTGLGIDPDDVPHLFERFYRGKAVSQSNTPGSGLGLAIVKEIVDVHGGKIIVESRPGEGTTIVVSLKCMLVKQV